MLWIVRLRRKSKKITLKEMSKLTGIGTCTISKIERYPDYAKICDLKNICKVLELDFLEVINTIC
ncbi:MAG: helix-turn-helix transcriptional regulator [Peptostreptococcaceae bacterium]|nr:helix-turn-helix transcriptional regulator [Peptostreptococcaceae bacterium]